MTQIHWWSVADDPGFKLDKNYSVWKRGYFIISHCWHKWIGLHDPEQNSMCTNVYFKQFTTFLKIFSLRNSSSGSSRVMRTPARSALPTREASSGAWSPSSPTPSHPASAGYRLVWWLELETINRWSCTIAEKAPTNAFTFKTLLRHYAKQMLTPR